MEPVKSFLAGKATFLKPLAVGAGVFELGRQLADPKARQQSIAEFNDKLNSGWSNAKGISDKFSLGVSSLANPVETAKRVGAAGQVVVDAWKASNEAASSMQRTRNAEQKLAFAQANKKLNPGGKGLFASTQRMSGNPFTMQRPTPQVTAQTMQPQMDKLSMQPIQTGITQNTPKKTLTPAQNLYVRR